MLLQLLRSTMLLLRLLVLPLLEELLQQLLPTLVPALLPTLWKANGKTWANPRCCLSLVPVGVAENRDLCRRGKMLSPSPGKGISSAAPTAMALANLRSACAAL